MKFNLLFRLLVAICLPVLNSTVVSAQEGAKAETEKIVLFDGKNLDQWRGYKDEKIGDGWAIEEGALKLTKGGAGDIVTKAEFADFEFSFDWKVDKGSNSGIMYRVSLGDKAPYYSGPEFQILDDAVHADGKNPLTSAGAAYGMYVPEGKVLKNVGEWNSAKIVLNKQHLEHWLNGKKVVDAELNSKDWNDRLGKSKFKDWPKFGKNPSGHIAIQDHGDVVYYRNITVTPLNK